ncbi:MAG: helix-turn-helix domain-containing protein [Anaerolineales bacterium]|nr:helix-turn-helix domain-containing protein [Anaerolineales bacterium]
MEHLRRIQNIDQIKILSDARRLAILRLLMSKPATLSQLGQVLGEHPARVRHHLKLLEEAGLVELVGTRAVRGFVEKYYQAKARSFIFNELILPSTPGQETVVLLGSHDLALELLSKLLHQKKPNGLEILLLPVGSLDGLIALRQGVAQIAGSHLLDAESGEYNLPYVRHLFPDLDVTLFTLAYREQGLLVAPGNPHQIRDLQDLARPNMTMINRNRGSGTRLWLDQQLTHLGLEAEEVSGYQHEMRTHTAIAEAISLGQADVGLGLQASARQFGLGFIPLFQERFDLVLPREQIEKKQITPIFDYLQSSEFRRLVEGLGGYSTTHTGEQLDP